MAENNISLDELAGGSLPTNSFDMTSGVITTDTPNTPKKVVPVAGAAFNPDSVTPVDFNAIFPKVEKPSAIESSQLFADLDAAVEREKQNITDRQNQLFDAMKREVEAEEEAHEVSLLDASIEGASAEFDTNTDEVEDEDISMEIPLDINARHITVFD